MFCYIVRRLVIKGLVSNKQNLKIYSGPYRQPMKLFQYRADMIIFPPSTTLAAAFCTRCSLSISTAGSPNRILLHESSFDVMKACTNFSQSFWLIYLRILPTFLSAKNADLETLLTWLVILRWESTVTTRSRAFGEEKIMLLFTFILRGTS